MFLHVVVFASCLWVVNAHIYTINIFNGKQDQDLVQTLSYNEVQDCNPLNCDQSCRRIGFPGGACVKGHCKCDILEPLALSELEKNLQYDKVQDCNPLNCDQSCRRIGFPGGACANGHCKCDILKPSSTIELEQTLTYNKVQGCNPLNCDQSCRRNGFPSGACVNGHCKCDILKSSPTIPEEAKSKDKKFTTPSDREENTLNIINDAENLKILRDTKKDNTETQSFTEDYSSTIPSEPESKIYYMDCTSKTCGLICHKMNYLGGKCVNKKCTCF